MEIRANYVLVGLTTVITALACLIFVFWLGQRGASKHTALYDINFPSASAGIGTGTDVLFLGVKVGSIKEITISPQNLSVRVRIEIDATTPVREDTFATIEMRSIAGGSYILLTSPTTSAPLLARDGQGVAQIRAGVSKLEQITNDVPALLNSATSLVESLRLLVEGENSQRVSNILASLESISGVLSAREGDIDQIVDNLNSTMDNIAAMSANLSSLSGSLDGYIRGDLADATQAFANMAGDINATAEEISPGLNRFANEGLDELRRMLAEIRQLVLTYERLGRRLESDPARFFFGNTVPEYSR